MFKWFFRKKKKKMKVKILSILIWMELPDKYQKPSAFYKDMISEYKDGDYIARCLMVLKKFFFQEEEKNWNNDFKMLVKKTLLKENK